MMLELSSVRRNAIALGLLLYGCAVGLPPTSADESGAGGAPPDASPSPNSPRPSADAAALTVSVAFDSPECTMIPCPAQAPFPVGCADVVMTGTATLGCVVSSPGTPAVGFEQGNLCRSDSVSGRVLCSSVPGPPLDASNCPLPRSDKLYLSNFADCDYR